MRTSTITNTITSTSTSTSTSNVKRGYEIGHEPVGRLLLRYSTPAVIGMLVGSSYNLVNAVFVGRGVGALALAGLAIAFPIQMFILAMSQVVGIGSASVISRCLGAGDARKAARTAGTSFGAVTALSIVLTVGGLAVLGPALRLFGATPAVFPYAAEYLTVILMGSFFYCFAISTHNIVRSEGNVRVSMNSMLLGAAVNMALDPIFIFVLHMGVRGAAIGTVIANCCSMAYLCSYFLRGKSMLAITLGDLWPDLTLLPEVFSVGSVAFTRVVGGSLFAIVLNNSIAHYGTDVHMAILGIITRILMFLLMPLIGIVHGLQPIIGYNYGAGNMDRVREAVRKASAIATLVATVGFLILMIVPRPILGIFNQDPALLSEGAWILRAMVLFLPLVGFQAIGASLFQAIGKAGPAVFLSMTRQVLFLVPFMLALPLFLGLHGIFTAFPVADLLSTAVTAIWVAAEFRRLRRHVAAPAGAPGDA